MKPGSYLFRDPSDQTIETNGVSLTERAITCLKDYPNHPKPGRSHGGPFSIVQNTDHRTRTTLSKDMVTIFRNNTIPFSAVVQANALKYDILLIIT